MLSLLRTLPKNRYNGEVANFKFNRVLFQPDKDNESWKETSLRSGDPRGHVVYVDLSAKAEQLLLDSAVAVADGVQWVLLIPASSKVRLHQWLLSKHGRKSLQYRLLALMIFLAIKERLAELDQIVIDQDYTGKQPEATIKNLLLPLLRQHRTNVSAAFIQFGQIRGSRADRLARQVYLSVASRIGSLLGAKSRGC